MSKVIRDEDAGLPGARFANAALTQIVPDVLRQHPITLTDDEPTTKDLPGLVRTVLVIAPEEQALQFFVSFYDGEDYWLDEGKETLATAESAAADDRLFDVAANGSFFFAQGRRFNAVTVLAPDGSGENIAKLIPGYVLLES